jgi:hypothetical protein
VACYLPELAGTLYFYNIKPFKMKHRFLLTMAAGLLTFTACQNENTAQDEAAIQRRIDSTVNARVDSMRQMMILNNDSLINAMAMLKADSMLAARGQATTGGTSRNTGRTNTTPSRPTTPATVGDGKPRMGSGNEQSGTVGEGKPRMGDQPNKSNQNTVGEGKPRMQ